MSTYMIWFDCTRYSMRLESICIHWSVIFPLKRLSPSSTLVLFWWVCLPTLWAPWRQWEECLIEFGWADSRDGLDRWGRGVLTVHEPGHRVTVSDAGMKNVGCSMHPQTSGVKLVWASICMWMATLSYARDLLGVVTHAQLTVLL